MELPSPSCIDENKCLLKIYETDNLLELSRVNRVVHDTRAVVGPRIQKAGLAGLTKRVAVAGVGSPAIGPDKEMEQKPHIGLE
ncbi:hypothetical protein Tco_0171425 [Tanacetum coccineum]